jgi:hypothetical protein
MLIEVTKAEKKLIEHALIRLGLETRPLDLPSEEDIKALWIKLYFMKEELEPVPEHFTLEESYND